MPSLPKIRGYKVEKELGRGGMARVYLAQEIKLDRQVALKVLNLLTDQGQEMGERFMREARTAAKLSHSNIVAIHDVGQIRKRIFFMAMEYLPGGVLAKLVERNALEPERALEIFTTIASALDYAHNKGFIHRDVKPDNILFREDGTPVLCDFGIARAVGSATRLTKTGMSVGTPHYMSPEQARGKQLDGRSDLYSLGVVLYEMLTGKVPFEAEDSVAVAIAHVQDPVPRLPQNLAKFQPLLDRLLAKDPDQRPQTGKEAIDLIQNPTNTERALHSEIPTDTGLNQERKVKDSSETEVGDTEVETILAQADHELKNTDLGLKLKTGIHKIRTHLSAVHNFTNGKEALSGRAKGKNDPWKRTLVILMILFFAILGVKLINNVNTRKEQELWRFTAAKGSVSAYSQYLEKYPKGEFAFHAHLSLEELRRKEEADRKREVEMEQRRRIEARKLQEARSRAESERIQRHREALDVENRVNRYITTVQQCIAAGDDRGALAVLNAALKLKKSPELQIMKADIESRLQKKSEVKKEQKQVTVDEEKEKRPEVVKEGQIVEKVDILPTPISKVFPEVNKRLRKKMVTGAKLVISYLIGERGKVERIKIIRGSGVTEIDLLFVRHVSLWIFKPAIKDGKRVKYWKNESILLADQ